MAFHNRKRELDLLDDLYARPGGQLFVLYGRRRVGKRAKWGKRPNYRVGRGDGREKVGLGHGSKSISSVTMATKWLPRKAYALRFFIGGVAPSNLMPQ